MKYREIVMLVAITAFATGCGVVNSSELKTTKAADLKISATVNEYNDSDIVTVGAQMQTLASEVGIDLNQGETLTAASQTEESISENVFLSDSGLFNLDQNYEGSIDKTISGGNYYITYTDSDGVSTTAIFATGYVSELITPVEDAVLTGDTVLVTWDPEGMIGPVIIMATWSGGNSFGFSRRTVDNTGSYDFDISSISGYGTVELIHRTPYNSMEGFGSSDIDMNNISRRNVSFANASTKSMKSLVQLSPEDEVEDMLHRCLKHCEEGEEVVFFVEEIEYSCCIEE